MLKYTNTQIVFQEVPDEISLAINISNCPIHCEKCHSKFLWNDIGEFLNVESLKNLIENNYGITCVLFMGGDINPKEIDDLAFYVKKFFMLKTAWYSGEENVNENIDINNFDFIKIGPYIEKKGGLDKKTTNQKFFIIKDNKLINKTNLFWYMNKVN